MSTLLAVRTTFVLTASGVDKTLKMCEKKPSDFYISLREQRKWKNKQLEKLASAALEKFATCYWTNKD